MQDKLSPTALRQAEYTRTMWYIRPPHGTSFEAVCSPEYWSHVAAKLKPGDRIEVLAEDGSYFAELLVRSTTKISATVFVLRQVEVAVAKPARTRASAKADPAAIAIAWRGKAKFSAVRGDGEVLFEGCETQEEAERRLAEFQQVTA